MALDQIRVNGKDYSHGEIVVRVDGQRIYGWTEITYSDKVEVSEVFVGPMLQDTTRGRYSTDDGTLRGRKKSVEALRTYLDNATRSRGLGYSYTKFQISVQGIDPETGQVLDHVLEQTRVLKDGQSISESADPLTDELGIKPTRIKRNGKYLFNHNYGT